jgi:hypothetical protein
MAHELKLADGVILQAIDESENKDGFNTSYTFCGTRTQCQQQRLIERGYGAKSLALRPRGDGNWELVSTYPTNQEIGNGDGEQPSETHELDVSMSQQDVYLNPKFVAALSESLRQTVRDYVEKYKRGEFETWTAALAALNSATSSNATAASYFSLFALGGVDSFIFYRAVYSKTVTGATPRQVRASFTGNNKLWTTAQVLTQENLPNDWWFSLAGVHTYWHKSMPRVSTNIGKSSKTQINYQYIGSDEASTLLYDNY